MRLSIVVSTYNGKKYIVEQMDSLRKQDRQADEILFFDDRSSDNTVDIINDYIRRYKLENWKVYVNSENKGWKRNFIEGLWQATGDLIFPCDQDDIWLPQKLRESEEIMKLHSEIELLTSNCEAFYDNGKKVIRPEAENKQIIKQKFSENIFETRYPGCTYCVRKELVDKTHLYWEEDFPHDALLWRLAMFSETLYSYNSSLIQWRRHSDSAYTVESIQSKSKNKKREWIEYGKRVIYSLMMFVKDEDSKNLKNKICVLEKSLEWLECRGRFYDSKKIIEGIKLFKYIKCYPKFKQYIGDWYLVFANK